MKTSTGESRSAECRRLSASADRFSVRDMNREIRMLLRRLQTSKA